MCVALSWRWSEIHGVGTVVTEARNTPKEVLFLHQNTRSLEANSAGHLRKALGNDLLNNPEIPSRSIPVHLTSLEHRGGPCDTPSLPLP
jgi:hypothetical protein